MTLQSATVNTELLAQEAKVANLLTLAWNEFAKLARDDAGRQDFLRLINQAQYMALAGPGIRQLNEVNLVNQANAQAEAQARGEVVQQQGFDTAKGEFVPLEEEAQMPEASQPPPGHGHLEQQPPAPPQPTARPRRRTKE